MYRFTSVDPIINKDEALTNPQLWNLYSYCRNNPITFLDPDGRKIVFSPNASQAFKDTVAIGMNYLRRSDIAKSLLIKMNRNPNVVILMESHSNITGYDSKSRELWFDPKSGNRLDNGNIQSPALGLLHEIDHAYRDISDPKQYKFDFKNKKGGFFIDEIKAVKMESRVGTQLGEPLRKINTEGTGIPVNSVIYKRNK